MSNKPTSYRTATSRQLRKKLEAWKEYFLPVVLVFSLLAMIFPEKTGAQSDLLSKSDLLAKSDLLSKRGILSITNIKDNIASYRGNSIPKYEKIEITFEINGTTAENYYLPYDDNNSPPRVQSGIGITVNALFSPDNWKTVYTQPAFYYQHFDGQVKAGNEWFYPTGFFSWKARFSPHKTGTWQYQLTAQDSSGTFTSPPVSFNVVSSSHRGFVQVSSEDPRYFEFEDGTYFPALGFNLNHKELDWVNPVLSNEPKFQIMQQNGLQFFRTWLTQWSIYGSAWAVWYSPNPAHRSQEPIMGLAHEGDARFANYPKITPPLPPQGSEFYMWLNHDETIGKGGRQYDLTPCRQIGWIHPAVPLKQNTNYRVRVRYNAQGLVGPRVAGKPYGFVIKEAAWLWNNTDETKRCYYPGTGTVLAATYRLSDNDPWKDNPDSHNPGWRILEGTFNSGAKDFIDKYLFLAIENAKASNPDDSAGHVFIDQIWLEEDFGNGRLGPNIIYKPWMSHHLYINQRNAYAFDKVISLAEKYDIYLKPVLLEKNDAILRSFGFDGSKLPTRDNDVFYGNGREANGATKVRWLQKAWWRYAQARWGYSPHIHSWELLNEGPPTDNPPHFTLADEFGKYMHCGVFGIDPGSDCTYDHPNDHMISTSFYSQNFPYRFWKNTSGNYPDVDFADQHLYIREDDPASFFDEAIAQQSLSGQRGAKQSGGAAKPIVRGEVAWQFTKNDLDSQNDLFTQNAADGLWLHNYIWAGIHPGGAIDQYWVAGKYARHIYQTGSHDHRPKFGNFYRFIKDIPLNNGNYVDVQAQVSNDNLRAWGQKDLANSRAHLWIQNKKHTWKNVADGVNIPPISATVLITGLKPESKYIVDWWDTYSGVSKSRQTIPSDSSGNLTLKVTNLTADVAVKISQSPLSRSIHTGR